MYKETLKKLREVSGKSCAEVAEALNVRKQMMYRYEQGKSWISIEQVLVLAKLYDVSAEDVINAQLNSYHLYLLNGL